MATTQAQTTKSSLVMHQCPVSTSEKKLIDLLSKLDQQKKLMQSCSKALQACTLCSMKAMEEGLDCTMVSGIPSLKDARASVSL